MKLIPKTNTLRKSILLYRKIRHRRGHGVHSPFVFNLITKVIEECCCYYSFYDIELLRKQLLQKEEKITYPDRHRKGKYRTRAVGKIVAGEAISPKHGSLLFRLTNYFKPKTILQIGPSMGLSTLYLSSYTTGLHCITLEQVKEYGDIAGWIYQQAARNPVDLRIGPYKDTLPAALKDRQTLDFIYLNTTCEHQLNDWLFDTCLNYIHNDTVFVIKGIKMNTDMCRFWKKVRIYPQVTVSIDLYSMGILFFNKKLHKKHYTVYF